MINRRQFYVYILTSIRNGTLYCGVTNDLAQGVYEHREGLVEGFTRKHGVKILVWFEVHVTVEAAISREKQIKEWKRVWKLELMKLELIETDNPNWRDLYLDVV